MDFTITFTGTTALLMHNGQLADPLNPIVKAMKEITAKRKKTEEDHVELGRLEFLGSLYLDPDVGPYIPGDNIESCLIEAGKLTREGLAIKRALFIKTDVNPLSYKGPRTGDELWAEGSFRHYKGAKVSGRRIMRTRPIFRQWSTDAAGVLDDRQLDFDQLRIIAENAGSLVGLGDWKPRFGRFTVTLKAV